MADHDLSAGGDVLDRVTACARAALADYGVRPDADVRLLNVSENATFLVTDADAGPSVLRVHRLGYHSQQAIASELAWMDALRAEAGIRTPRVLPAADGRRIVSVTDHGVPGRHPATRLCVRFEFLPGPSRPDRAAAPRPPRTSRSSARSPRGCTRTPGTGTGRPGSPGSGGTSMRRSARSRGGVAGRTAWASAPPRPRSSGGLSAGCGRGSRRSAPALSGSGWCTPTPGWRTCWSTRAATAVIDFDDSGFAWYLYDLGTAVSFFEHDPAVPGLVACWLDGYRRAGARLPAADEAEIWTFIMFRRLLLVAWIGSHPAAAGAAELGAGYTRDSCDLAEWYLTSHQP